MDKMSNNLEMDELLVKYLLESATLEERKAVKEWFGEDIEHKRYFDQLRDIFFLGKITQENSGFDTQKCLDEVKVKFYKTKLFEANKQKEIQERRLKSYRFAISIAASLVFLIGIAYFLLFAKNGRTSLQSGNVVYNEVVTPKGSRTNITLPDGTNVWLNAESRIKYAMDFIKGERIVYLTGEAFFDVAKIKGKLFIVNTDNIAVKAWGTKFNVKAYPEENIIQTTLVEGSVSIKKLGSDSNNSEEYLKPSQTAIFYKKTPSASHNTNEIQNETKKEELSPLKLKKIEVKTELFTSWKDKKWIIENQTLKQLAPELERRYNVEITFEDKAILLYKVSGSLENETFDQVLKVIKLSAPIDYEINSNHVIVRENKTSKNIYEKFLKK